MRPRLLFLNNQGLASAGGGVTILRHLVAGLATDHAVTVASFDPPGPAPAGVAQITLPAAPGGGNWHLAPLARARHLRASLPGGLPGGLLAGADAVIAFDCHFALALAAVPRRRLVYLSLSCIPRQEWFAFPDPRMLPRVAQYAWLERRLARAAGAVIVSSRRHGDELRRFSALPRLVPAVLPPVFPAAPAASDPPRPTATDSPVLLCLGRLEAVKRPALALALMARLEAKGAELWFAGDGPEEPRLRAEAAALGLGPRVRFLGRVDAVEALLARASLLVHPSAYESFGIAVFEAMRAGVPPVCAASSQPRTVTACAEFATDGSDAMFVNFSRPDEAAGRIAALLADPARRAAMGEAARRSAERLLASDYVAGFRRQVLAPLGLEIPA